MRIILTGASGMVGKNLMEHSQVHAHEIVAPTRSELDLFDANAVSKFFGKVSPDIVVHCAGYVGGIQANIREPFDFLFKNIKIGLNVIGAALETNVSRVLNLGSSCMYPKLASNPLHEESILTGPLEPTNEGYAIAKVAVERLGRYASQQYDVNYKTIIPCNLYGRWDKFDPLHSHMIPAVIRKVHDAVNDGVDELDIWGDGTARREFMFAADLADFIYFAISKFDQIPILMNVGLGHDYSIKEYYESIATIIGFTGSFNYDISKPVGMKQKLVDISEQKKLGWKPSYSLAEGISATYQFFLERK